MPAPGTPHTSSRAPIHPARRAARWIALTSAAAGLLIGHARSARAQEGGIAVGATAPGAAVVTLEGTPVDLAQFIGRTPVVLEFWATWCPLCRKLEPAMAAARERYAGRVTFVSVGVPNNQTAERQRAYATERRIGGEFVFDRDSKAVGAYHVPHTSYVVVIGKDAKVAYTGVGGDQDIASAVAKVVDQTGSTHR